MVDEERSPDEGETGDGPRVRRDKRVEWEDVPKLPYNRSLRLVWSDLIRIAMFVTMLVALIVLRPHCSSGAAGFIESFSGPPDAGVGEGLEPPEGYIRLTPEDVEKYFPRRGPDAETGTGAEGETGTDVDETGTDAGGKTGTDAEGETATDADDETAAGPRDDAER